MREVDARSQWAKFCCCSYTGINQTRALEIIWVNLKASCLSNLFQLGGSCGFSFALMKRFGMSGLGSDEAFNCENSLLGHQ